MLLGLSLWIVLGAFAGGCTAMTGVEAFSNGISAFNPLVTRHAHRTLTVIVSCSPASLYLTRSDGILAMDQEQPGYHSVLSQLVGAIVGHGVLYHVAIASVLCVLSLSAAGHQRTNWPSSGHPDKPWPDAGQSGQIPDNRNCSVQPPDSQLHSWTAITNTTRQAVGLPPIVRRPDDDG